MRKALQRAIRNHLRDKASITGFLLVTISDGEVSVTANAGDNDDSAQDTINALLEVLMEPQKSLADDGGDEIGPCAGIA